MIFENSQMADWQDRQPGRGRQREAFRYSSYGKGWQHKFSGPYEQKWTEKVDFGTLWLFYAF